MALSLLPDFGTNQRPQRPWTSQEEVLTPPALDPRWTMWKTWPPGLTYSRHEPGPSSWQGEGKRAMNLISHLHLNKSVTFDRVVGAMIGSRQTFKGTSVGDARDGELVCPKQVHPGFLKHRHL